MARFAVSTNCTGTGLSVVVVVISNLTGTMFTAGGVTSAIWVKLKYPA
jgi:hypothetical protein